METKRKAAFSTKVRPGKITTHPGWYVRVFDGAIRTRNCLPVFSSHISEFLSLP